MESRAQLLSTLLAGLAKLPKVVWVLIASRWDEPSMHVALSLANTDVRDTPMDDNSASDDIELLF